MPFKIKPLAAACSATLLTCAMSSTSVLAGYHFERVSVFPAFLNTDVDEETVAEIVDATKDGNTLLYTDSETGHLGFVDITDPTAPAPLGVVPVGGEPTSVAVAGDYALVGVNTSPSFVAPSGKLVIVEISSRTIVATHDLGGQPDSVATSPDEQFAAIAIENERDEDLGDGEPPQLPPGFLVVVDLVGDPADWVLTKVALEGIADVFPEDPEPEYVDINARNIAVVTLQENNHIIYVDLASKQVVNDYSAGTVDLTQIDTLENDLIELDSSLDAVPREPDGVTWISQWTVATADEGDLFGGSRGFTVFDPRGDAIRAAGNSLEHQVVRMGHYPEDRSENKGNEPENAEFGVYGERRFLFVGSERSSVVFVYDIDASGAKGRLLQTLPAGVGPEGLKAIPGRDLFVAASEVDDRDAKIRSVVNIYQGREGAPTYPTVISADRADGTPIPWGALSGLATAEDRRGTVWAVHDSFYNKSRIYAMDVEPSVSTPALIDGEIVLNDSLGKLAAVDPGLVNGDAMASVALDLEGIAKAADGFWVVSEGSGTVGDEDQPFESLNLLLQVAMDGTITRVVTLPRRTNERQVRFGYEGVTVTGPDGGPERHIYVAFQREWTDDPDGHVRIGRYDLGDGSWKFYYYPLDVPTSPNGGWVGLSEITALDRDRFMVIERDNQGGLDARIKRLYEFSVAGLKPLPDAGVGETPAFPVVSKTLVRDLVSDLEAPGGLILEKIEGMALHHGEILVVNDNDGVDDSNGETQLLRLNR